MIFYTVFVIMIKYDIMITRDDIMPSRAKREMDDTICVEAIVQQYVTGLLGITLQRAITLSSCYSGQHWSSTQASLLFDNLDKLFSNMLSQSNPGAEWEVSVTHAGFDGAIKLTMKNTNITLEERFKLRSFRAGTTPAYFGIEQLSAYALSELAKPDTAEFHIGILVVDANEEILRFFRDILCPHYAVFTASTKQQLRMQIGKSEISLVLGDTQFSDGDAAHVVASSGKPWIAFSVLLHDRYDLLCLNAGAILFHPKPFCARSAILSLRNVVKLIPASRNNTSKHFLSSLLRHIDEHLSNPEFTAESLALMMHTELRTLQRRCKQATQQSPSTLIRSRRLSRAASLLLRGEKALTAALECGFSHSESFSRAFKQHFGTPPSEFAKQNG